MLPFTVGESTVSKRIISMLPRCIRPFAFVRKLKAEGFRPGVALQGVVTEWYDLPKQRGVWFKDSYSSKSMTSLKKEVSNFCEGQKKRVVSSFASAIAFFVPRCTYKHIRRNHIVANLKSWSCCWTWGTRLFTVLDRAPLMKFGCWKCLVFFFFQWKTPLRIEMVYSPERTRGWRRLA